MEEEEETLRLQLNQGYIVQEVDIGAHGLSSIQLTKPDDTPANELSSDAIHTGAG